MRFSQKILATATLCSFATVIFPISISVSANDTKFAPVKQQSQEELDNRKAANIVADLLSKMIAAKDYKLALNICNQAINNYPGYAPFHIYRAVALFELGQKAAALPDFETARKLYRAQVQSAKSGEERSEAESGLQVVELFLVDYR